MAIASQQTIPIAHQRSFEFYMLPGLVGFGLTFQTALTLLFFRTSPEQATIAILAFSCLALFLAIVSSVGAAPSIPPSCFKTPTIRWAAAFLGFAFLSISWTAAPLLSAGGYWATWAADIFIVWLLLSRPNPMQQAHSLFKGAIWGATLVALIAWYIPPTIDLRLGNEDFLHPNVLGRLFSLTILLALYLARENKIWRWPALWLAITLLRTLSKTSIVAFIAAILFYLVYDSALGRRTKIWFGVISAAVLISFWTLLETYLEAYSTQGASLETFTGRTIIWGISAEYALEKPLFGYGFYSYRTIIPPFGQFEAWQAHNELLQQFFSFGLLGAVAVIGLYWAFFRQIRRAPASHLKTLAATLLVFALVRGLTDAEVFDLSCPIWLVVMLSILLSSTANELPAVQSTATP